MGDIRDLRIFFIGEPNVGKTCIIERFTGKKFEANSEPTIGVSHYGIKAGVKNGHEITLDLWDVSGQERFKEIIKIYFKGAHGCFFVYDITNRDSFEKINEWFDRIHKEVGDIPIILVGNKSDLEEERQVSTEEGMNLAKEKNVKYFETSAKDNININAIFKAMSENILGEGFYEKLRDLPTSNDEFDEEGKKKEKKRKKRSHNADYHCYHT